MSTQFQMTAAVTLVRDSSTQPIALPAIAQTIVGKRYFYLHQTFTDAGTTEFGGGVASDNIGRVIVWNLSADGIFYISHDGSTNHSMVPAGQWISIYLPDGQTLANLFGTTEAGSVDCVIIAVEA